MARLWILISLLSLLGALSPALAQNLLQGEPDERLKPYQRLYIDLHQDGRPESVGLVAYNHSQDGYLGQLIFYDEKGTPIWEGPRAVYQSGQALRQLNPRLIMENPLIFGKIRTLEYQLKFVLDPDKDGRILVAIADLPQGVQFSTFRILRWDGKTFQVLHKNCHLVEDPLNPGYYVWTNRPLHTYETGYSDGRWVRDLRLTNDPQILKAIIREIKHPFSGRDRSPRIRRGEALMEPLPTGAKLKRWEHTLQKWYKISLFKLRSYIPTMT